MVASQPGATDTISARRPVPVNQVQSPAKAMQERVEQRANGFLKTIKEFDEALDRDLAKMEWLAPLSFASQSTGVSRSKILALGAVMVAYACTIGFGGIISNLVGFIYPAYRSYKAIKTEDKDDDTQWLTYWVVYAFFTVADGLFGVLFTWVPLYFFFKIGFLVWCMHPRAKGATFILRRVIVPLLEKYETHIDQAGARLSEVFQRGAAGAKGQMDTIMVSGMQHGMSFYGQASRHVVDGDEGERNVSSEFRQGEAVAGQDGDSKLAATAGD